MIHKNDSKHILAKYGLPFLTILFFSLMVAGFAILPGKKTVRDYYGTGVRSPLTKLEKDRLDIYRDQAQYENLTLNIATEQFLKEFTNELHIDPDAILEYKNNPTSSEPYILGALFGKLIYSSTNFQTVAQYFFTFAKSSDSNLADKVKRDQVAPGYFYYENNLTGDVKIINRQNVTLPSNASNYDAVVLLDSLPGIGDKLEDYPTLNEMINLADGINTIPNLEAIDLTLVRNDIGAYSRYGYAVIIVAIEEWEKYEKEFAIALSLGLVGLFGFFIMSNYIFWALKIRKRSKNDANENN